VSTGVLQSKCVFLDLTFSKKNVSYLNLVIWLDGYTSESYRGLAFQLEKVSIMLGANVHY